MLTVTLLNSEFEALNEANKGKVYAEGFTYDYSKTTNMLLRNAINAAANAINATPGIHSRQFSFEVPDLSHGDYDIVVTATPLALTTTDWQWTCGPFHRLSA